MKKNRVLPQGWKEVKIGDVFETGSGGTPLSTNREYYDGGNIPWINSGELNENYIDSTSNHITQLGLDNSSAKIYPSGTVLVAMYGATAGKSSLLNIDACTNQAICAILENPEYSNLFLKYNIENLYDYLVNTSTGSARDNLSQEGIAELRLFFPEGKSRQEKLIKVLQLIDQKISLNTRINAELEAMAKQLYDYWFVQFDFPDENGKPYKSSGGKMVYNETLKREIPEGWEESILSDIANITMGQSPDGSSYNEEGEGTVFYQGSTDFGLRFPSVRMFTTSPSRFAKKGDILMSVRAPVGDTNIANEDCCIGRGLSAINSKIGSISHLYFILGDLKARFDTLNGIGTTFGAITKDELYNLPVVKPNKDILLNYEKLCSPIFDKQMTIGYENDNLTHLRDSLLPMLMNGQVTIE